MKTTKIIDQKSKLEWKKKYSFALTQHLKNSNWEKIEELLPAAESYGVSAQLLQNAWTELGQHQKKDDKLVSALVSFAAARKHALDNNHLFSELLDCLTGFIDLFEPKFSREDLVLLEYGLDRVYSFQKLQPNSNEPIFFRAKELQIRIKDLLIFAPSKAETVASPNVQRIYAALYSDMTQDEVRTEFARLFMEMSGDEYEKRLKEKKKAKKKPSSTGGKKPPKDGNDKDKPKK